MFAAALIAFAWRFYADFVRGEYYVDLVNWQDRRRS